MKISKKSLLSVLTLTLVACLFSIFIGVSSATNVHAADKGFTMAKGAQVRIVNAAEQSGLKFTAQISKEKYQSIQDASGEDKTYKSVSYGMLIAPANYLSQYADFTVENLFGDDAKYDWAEYQNGEWVYSGSNGANGSKVRIMNIPSSDLTYNGEEENYYVAGAIVDYKESNIVRDFVGKAYIKYTAQDDTVTYELADYYESDITEGLLEGLKNWVFVEWSKANDFTDGINYPTNMLYCKALEVAGKLYCDGALIKKAENNRKMIIKQSFNGDFFEDNAVRNERGELKLLGHTSETCQYYALFLGFADGDNFSEYRNKIITYFGRDRDDSIVFTKVYKSNAFIGNMLRLCYLLKSKEYKRLLREIEEYFYEQAMLGSTLWEHDKPVNSLNHGFASYAACLIIESLKNSDLYKYSFELNKG